jgi:hypothetical protein
VSRVRLVFLSSQMSGNAFQRLQRSDPMSFEGIPKRSLRRQTDICVSAGTYPVHIGSFLAAHRWIKRVDYLISFFFKDCIEQDHIFVCCAVATSEFSE